MRDAVQKCKFEMLASNGGFIDASAHTALDAAVEQAYGVNFAGDEEKIVGHLFKLYEELTRK